MRHYLPGRVSATASRSGRILRGQARLASGPATGDRLTPMSSTAPVTDGARLFKALASPKRLQILDWLKNPVAHFPPQRDGDLVKDGVCVIFIADKLGVAQPTATTHLQALARAGLVTSKRMGQWTFYQRDEAAIKALMKRLREDL